jgi:hypothetical protein
MRPAPTALPALCRREDVRVLSEGHLEVLSEAHLDSFSIAAKLRGGGGGRRAEEKGEGRGEEETRVRIARQRG